MAKKKIITALISSAIALTYLSSANASEEKEKCYGTAKAGHNDCSAKGHNCAGHAEVDNDPEEWVFVEKGKCAEAGGKLESSK